LVRDWGHVPSRGPVEGYPWSLVESLVDDQRFVLAGVINRADAEDQMLITLMLTPPLGGQEGLD
jgi:hypothetical protein